MHLGQSCETTAKQRTRRSEMVATPSPGPLEPKNPAKLVRRVSEKLWKADEDRQAHDNEGREPAGSQSSGFARWE